MGLQDRDYIRERKLDWETETFWDDKAEKLVFVGKSEKSTPVTGLRGLLRRIPGPVQSFFGWLAIALVCYAAYFSVVR